MAIESVISKLSSEALGKAVTKSEGMGKPIEQGSSFKQIMDNTEMGMQFAEQLGITDQPLSTTGNMQSLSGDNVSFKPGDEVTSIGQPETSQKVVDLLSEVNKGQMQMDSMVNNILYSGKKFSNQELLCIQAHVFHFAQMTELTVKVAEQGISSVKAVLNTQVQ